jgi:hypothetical protein
MCSNGSTPYEARAIIQELNAANFIWAFDFLPAIDPDTGKEVYPDLDNHTEVSDGSTAVSALLKQC